MQMKVKEIILILFFYFNLFLLYNSILVKFL